MALGGDRGVLGWPDRDALGGVAAIGVGRTRGDLSRVGLRGLRYPCEAAVISNSTESVNFVPLSWRHFETTCGTTVIVASNTWQPSSLSNWPPSANVRDADGPPRKPVGKLAGKLPVPATLRAAPVVHRDLKPASLVVHAPRMRRPHQRGQGPA